MENNPKLSERDSRKREMILHGNMWMVLLRLGAPLALYSGINTVFSVIDAIIAANISPVSVSAIAYLSQLGLTLSAVGCGLATGSSIAVSHAFGAGDYALVRKRVSTLLFMCGGFSLMLLALIPFTVPFLRLVGTPREFIAEGAAYFALTLIDAAFDFVNTAYIAIERARGATKRIMRLNTAQLFVKLGLMVYFVYVLHMGITMIAVATLAADFVITAAGIYRLFIRGRHDAFGFSTGDISFSRGVSLPMIRLSIPVMIERASFFFGKFVVNSMATGYGALTVGALGISNVVSGITNSIQCGMQDAGSAVVGQNVGAGKTGRAVEAFYKMCVIECAFGAAGYLLFGVFLRQIAWLFARNDAAFAELIIGVTRYEMIGLVPLGFFTAAMALLYGFGYTEITFYINFCRVFLLRIPVLWALQRYTDIGSESVGIVMMVSNVGTGIMGIIAAVYVLRRIKGDKYADDRRARS